MQEIAEQLRAVVAIVGPELSRLDSGDVATKDRPGRVVEEGNPRPPDRLGREQPPAVRPGGRRCGAGIPALRSERMGQNPAVQRTPVGALVSLWSAYNDHLSHVIACIPDVAKPSPCNIGTPEPVALEFVVTDYLRHLKHHLKDILGGEFL